MAKFAVQGETASRYATIAGIDLAHGTDAEKLGISLTSGVTAGVAAAVVSHPADTLLSLMNKQPGMGGDGNMISRMFNVAMEVRGRAANG